MRRSALAGPHRDELDVIHAAKRVPAAQSSTGEQKAMLVAMTLAHAALAAEGRASLLLLDEVAAHLDPVRRAALFDQLRTSGAQVWMTEPRWPPSAALRRMRRYGRSTQAASNASDAPAAGRATPAARPVPLVHRIFDQRGDARGGRMDAIVEEQGGILIDALEPERHQRGAVFLREVGIEGIELPLVFGSVIGRRAAHQQHRYLPRAQFLDMAEKFARVCLVGYRAACRCRPVRE